MNRPFCSNCHAYFPAGATCPACQQPRTALATPAAPGVALWHAELPGSIGRRLVRVEHERRELLIVPWYWDPLGTEAGEPTGGVTALDPGTGHVCWECPLGMPVEGGVAVGDDVVYAGLGLRGVRAGKGALAAVDLATGDVFWHVPVDGAVLSTPVLDERRVYVTAGDGQLHAFDAVSGARVFAVQVAKRAVQMPADPVLVTSRGDSTLLVASYAAPFGREPGVVAAFNRYGETLWRRSIDGNVRGMAAVGRKRVYVAAFAERPSRGLLLALDKGNGEPLWDEPFIVSAPPGTSGGASFRDVPLAHGDTIYVGSHDHHLYAVDVATGARRWEHKIGRGISAGPAWVDGLVVFGDNEGYVYAVESATGACVWVYELGGSIQTSPLVHKGVVFVGSNTNAVAALPWHLGQYAWAADRLEAAGRHLDAGDCRALSAHHALVSAQAEPAYQRAAEDWQQAGVPERAGQMWLQLGRRSEAAAAFRQAGELWRSRDRERATRWFAQAALQYYWLRDGASLNACTDALSVCAGLPLVRVHALNSTLVQWEEGQLVLELRNMGKAPLTQGLALSLSGDVPVPLQAAFQDPLPVGQAWRIPLTAVLCAEKSSLEVEVRYQAEGYGELRGLFPLSLRAVPRPRPPVQFGEVGSLRLTIPGATAEGVVIQAGGDIGAVIERNYGG